MSKNKVYEILTAQPMAPPVDKENTWHAVLFIHRKDPHSTIPPTVHPLCVYLGCEVMYVELDLLACQTG